MISDEKEVKLLIAFLDNNFQRTILKLTRFDKDQISSSKPSDKVCYASREEYSRLYRCLDNAIDRLHYHSGDNFDFYRTRASHTISLKNSNSCVTTKSISVNAVVPNTCIPLAITKN